MTSPAAARQAYYRWMKNSKSLARSALPLGMAVLMAVAAVAAHAAGRVNAGKWESIMVTDGDSRVISFCLGADQAAALNADAKAGRDYAEKKSGGHCSVTAYDVKGDTVSYSLSCGNRTISDITHFHGDTSDGTKTTTADGTKVITQIKSTRLGACP
jgi:hypothetical protein